MKRIIVAAAADVSAFNAIPVHLAGVCGALKAQGCDVTLVVPRPPGNRPPAVDYVAAGIRLCLVPSISQFGLKNATNLPVLLAVLLALKLQGRADAFYLRFTVGTFFIAHLLRLLGARVITEHNGWMADEVRQFGGGRALMAFARWCQLRDVAAASASRAVSESVSAALVANGADPEKIFVADNATDLSRFRPLQRNAALAESGLPGDNVFTLGLLANLTRWQGAHIAVEAMQHLPDCRLVIAGDGPEMGTLKALVRQFSVADRVLFLGAVPVGRANAVTNCFDLALIPFPSDRPAGAPIKLRDYCAAGRPVLASDEVQNRREAKPDWARLFRADDPADLARKVRELKDAPEVLAQMGASARLWAEKQFSWDKTAQLILARFERS